MLVAAAQAVLQFQITAAGGIEDHAVLVALDPQPGQVGQGAALGVLDVLQQTAGGGDRDRLVGATETVQVAHPELGAQGAHGAVAVEMPRRLPAQARMLPPALGRVGVLADQQFRRFQPFQFVEQRRFALHLHDREPAAAQVQMGQPVDVFGLVQGQQQIVAALVQQRLVGQGAGRDDPGHPPLHRPLAESGIAQLLADRHRQPQFDQPGEITFDGVERHAGHRNRRAGGLAAGGQGDVEQFGGVAGVVVKQLVEIPHPVEQQDAGMLGLDAQILLHHRGVLGEILSLIVHWGRARVARRRGVRFHGKMPLALLCTIVLCSPIVPKPRLFSNRRSTGRPPCQRPRIRISTNLLRE